MSEVEAANAQVAGCLTFGSQRSFFLSAGAGAGKTRALVLAVEQALSVNGESMEISGARIAVITYTRAARDEIRRRLKYDARVSVSTIHSFAWGLISPHTPAIKIVREQMLRSDNELLLEQELKGRRPSAASAARVRKIERNRQRLERLDSVERFHYSPDRDVPGRDELNHQEVIGICANLLAAKPLLAQIMVSRFPIVFIDEVQDTAKSILPVLLQAERQHQGSFTLGLFGDTMQRIYLDGVTNLVAEIPQDWVRPRIQENHRSATRIVRLANAIRLPIDNEMQVAARAERGTVRIFLASQTASRDAVELEVRMRMAVASGDARWNVPETSGDPGQTMTLILEHSLAASRLRFQGFADSFPSDVRDEIYGQGAATGSMVTFLGKLCQLLDALAGNRVHEADRLIGAFREESRQYESAAEITSRSEREAADPSGPRKAARGLRGLIRDRGDVPMLDVLEYLSQSNLFALPEVARELVEYQEDRAGLSTNLPAESVDESRIIAWLLALGHSWLEVSSYHTYITGNATVDTHQGVKGLEFTRVLAILDDRDAKGSWFSFDKLLETKDLSAVDLANVEAGKETTVDRTRRLFYVACTRAQEGLAIVYYVSTPKLFIENTAIRRLFEPEEIQVIPDAC